MANKTYSSCSTCLHSVMKMGEREMFGKPEKKARNFRIMNFN